ncbi:solute carrier family 23 protein [Lysinibacter sp. HNR]|uniref:uracil-xanthine permease family protein n=1 Tax=Lysinibacter sp. HNR TaxID=3031408 RepID=UPI002435FB7F|nr:solute carrier family 23 protein [Lysinibacter sp. HNR]WGD37705.1 solute carrier family 23 protein [Lysinibacter sp. HNR]
MKRSPWTIHGTGKTVIQGRVVAPSERLSWPRTIGIGMQHVIAMFGATFLVPIITGFPVSTTLLFSGLGTLLFLILTKNRMPSYLGSSFAFITPILAAQTGFGIPGALLGIVIIGILFTAIGGVTQRYGTGWINTLMPPVVAGAIVALIGFNLIPTAYENFTVSPLTAYITLGSVIVCTVVFRGIIGRVSIFVGVVIGYVTAMFLGEVDFSAFHEAPWLGLPDFTLPANPFADPTVLAVLPAFVPVLLVLLAENVGHIRGVAQMVDPNLNKLTGRALIADGISTTLAGLFGGSGTTTYGENIGVMAATRVYSTAAYWVAGTFAILLGFSPKVGALIFSIPAGVLGGVTMALYGLIGIIGMKIWVDNRVDFGKPINQFTAGLALAFAIANVQFISGSFQLNGIAMGTLAAILVYHFMNAIERMHRRSETSRLTEAPAAQESPRVHSAHESENPKPQDRLEP